MRQPGRSTQDGQYRNWETLVLVFVEGEWRDL